MKTTKEKTKTGKIEIILIANKQIKIADLAIFEKYIEKRFGFKEIIIKIEYTITPIFTKSLFKFSISTNPF